MHSYFKYDTIFASDLYGIYNGSPCKSHTDRPRILYLLRKHTMWKCLHLKPLYSDCVNRFISFLITTAWIKPARTCRKYEYKNHKNIQEKKLKTLTFYMIILGLFDWLSMSMHANCASDWILIRQIHFVGL